MSINSVFIVRVIQNHPLQKTDSFPQYQSEGRYTSDFWKEPIPWRVPNSVTVCNDSLWKLSQPLRHKKRIELKGQSLYDQRTSYNILILVPHILLLHLILIFVEIPSSYVYQHNYHLGLKRVQNIYDMHLLESCFYSPKPCTCTGLPSFFVPICLLLFCYE